MTTNSTKPAFLVVAILAAIAVPATSPAADQTAPQRFKTKQAALGALVEAAAAGSTDRLRTILGADGAEVIESGDPVADANSRKAFVARARQRQRFETLEDGRALAVLGRDEWPLPIPLVRDGNGWQFDPASAKEEILNRRIGKNELTAIAVCRDYIEAQREYARVDRTNAGVRTYAQHILSTPGSHDGLYWDDASGDDPSPFGPHIAEAASESYAFEPGGDPAPYHGYFFRILTAQGTSAPRGARSYVKDGKMTDGFALVAYPAEYRTSGIMTFVVNQQGIVFQKDLGPDTTATGKAMTAYDPDASWTPVTD